MPYPYIFLRYSCKLMWKSCNFKLSTPLASYWYATFINWCNFWLWNQKAANLHEESRKVSGKVVYIIITVDGTSSVNAYAPCHALCVLRPLSVVRAWSMSRRTPSLRWCVTTKNFNQQLHVLSVKCTQVRIGAVSSKFKMYYSHCWRNMLSCSRGVRNSKRSQGEASDTRECHSKVLLCRIEFVVLLRKI